MDRADRKAATVRNASRMAPVEWSAAARTSTIFLPHFCPRTRYWRTGLAAIEAVPTIRPEDAAEILGDLLDSNDEDIVEAVEEALAMAKGLSGDTAWDDDDDEDA